MNETPELHSIVSELAQNAGIPRPKVAIVESSTPNAFATGRNPKKALVAVTTGILGLLNRDELERVLAHELGHVKKQRYFAKCHSGNYSWSNIYNCRLC